MKIGARNGTLKAQWNDAFAIAKEMGFDGVELDVGADFRESFLWDPEARKEVVSLQKTTGVELPCICIGGLWQLSPANPDEAIRAQAEEFITGTVRHCAEIGAWAILAPINDGRGEWADAAMERWVDIMKRVAPVAEERQVTVCLENCGCTAQYQLDMIQAVDAAYVKGYVDMANFMAAEDDSVEAIKLLGDSIGHVHAKDFAVVDGKRQGCRLGKGLIDVPGCVAALKEIGYDDYLTLETPPGQDAKAEAAKNLAFLKELI